MVKFGTILSILFLANITMAQNLIFDQRASYMTNAYKDKNQVSNFGYELFLGNKFNNKHTLTTFFYLFKSNEGDDEVKVQNGEIRYVMPIAEDKTYKTKIGFRAIIPLSEVATKQQDMHGGFVINPSWSLTLGSAGEIDFNINVEPRYYEYFYRYKTDVLGNYMTKRMVMGIGEFVTTFYDRVSIYIGYLTSTVWNTNGTRTFDRFSFYQDIEVNIAKGLYVTVGHSDSNFFMTPDGYQNSITLFDERSTAYYMRLLYSF